MIIDFLNLPLGRPILHKGLEAIPFNHYCDDCAWIVIIKLSNMTTVFATVDAIDPQEAAMKAIDLYLEGIDDE